MPVDVLSLVQFLLVAGAILMVITGLGLMFAGLCQAPYFQSFRTLISDVVRPVMNCPWRVMPITAVALVVTGYQVYVQYWFRQSEKNFIVGGMFAIVVLRGLAVVLRG